MVTTTLLSRARPIERIAYGVGGLLIAAGVFHFVVFLVDGGPWEGPVSWRKPTTFGLSFGLTLITVTWISSYVDLPARTRGWLLGIFAADCVLEVLGISIQAWRGVPSHFNTSTPFNLVVAMNLAFGGAILVVVLGWLAVTVFRGRVIGGRDLRLALQAGFAFLVLGLGAGIAMIAKGSVLYRTVSPEVAYDTAGSLKPIHAVGLHAILVLPLVAELTRLRGWPEARRHRAVAIATGLYVAATLVAVVLSFS